MLALGLIKQQTLVAAAKVIQQINFTGILTRDGNKTVFFIIEKEKELWETVRVLWSYFALI